MEVKDLITTLGLDPEKIKTVEEFKANVDSTFTRTASITEDSEPVKRIVGKLYGTLENEIKKVAKAHDLDIDLDADEIKGKKVTEKLKFAFSKYDEKNKVVIDELTTKAGLGNDDKVKEWESKYTKATQKAKDLEALLGATKTEYDTYKETSSNQIKGVKLDVLKKDVYSKVKFKTDRTDLEKLGFDVKINSKYDFDLDENDSIIALTKKGERIPSTKVSGAFKTALEILEEEAVAEKQYQLNADGGKPKPAAPFQQQQQPQGKPGRTVAPRM